MDIQAALKDGYSKDEIMAELGKRTGMNYKAALKDGHSPDDVLAELNSRDTRKRTPTNNPADYPQGKTVADQDAMRREFLKDQGTLGTRVRNTTLSEMAANVAKEAPRLAQEVVTVPLSSLKKGAYGLGALAKTGGALIRGKSVDAALQTGTDAMRGYAPIQGPLDPSMVGEAVGYGLNKGINAAENATGNTGFARAGIEAGADILGLVGGGKVAMKGARSLADLGKIGVKSAINAIPETVEMSMYQRGLKGQSAFNSLKTAELNKRLNTALDEGIPLNEKGVTKLKTTVADINNVVQNRIAEYADQGATVSMEKVMQPVEGIRAQASNQAFPNKANAQINSTVNEFANNPAIKKPSFDAVNSATPTEIPLAQAQKFKQSINTELNDFYEAMNKSPDKASYLARQWIAKTKAKIGDGLRAEISEIFPEVKALNQREGALLGLNKSLERAVNRIGQRDVVSLKFLQALMYSPKMAIAEFILNNPNIQSNLAIALRQARRKVNGVEKPTLNPTDTPYTPKPVMNQADATKQRMPLNTPLPEPQMVYDATLRQMVPVNMNRSNQRVPLNKGQSTQSEMVYDPTLRQMVPRALNQMGRNPIRKLSDLQASPITIKQANVPTWKEFTKSKMGQYMKSEGSHAGAMKRLSEEYKKLKSQGAQP